MDTPAESSQGRDGAGEGKRQRSADPPPTWFRRITWYGLLASLCPLIPFPYIDDWALAWVRRRMVREVLGNAQLQAATTEVRLLAGEVKRPFWHGCLSVIFLVPLFKIAIYLVRKVIKKILILLTLKEATDRFSETFHEGYLLHQAAIGGTLGEASGAVGPGTAQKVRVAVCQACLEVDPRPLNQLIKRSFRGSRWLLVEASRRLGKALGRERRASGPNGGEVQVETEAELEREGKELSGLLDRLTSALGHEEGYLQDLEKRFTRALEKPPEVVEQGSMEHSEPPQSPG
ncbi:MAG: hypothetical protein K0U98_05110 [Deltaproteobacteria bacterium]|nr:hypothetical protein [Deltaproteobacteria bacterium]